jgi:hypothetical protein
VRRQGSAAVPRPRERRSSQQSARPRSVPLRGLVRYLQLRAILGGCACHPRPLERPRRFRRADVFRGTRPSRGPDLFGSVGPRAGQSTWSCQPRPGKGPGESTWSCQPRPGQGPGPVGSVREQVEGYCNWCEHSIRSNTSFLHVGSVRERSAGPKRSGGSIGASGGRGLPARPAT